MVTAFVAVMGVAFLMAREESFIQQRIHDFFVSHSPFVFYFLLIAAFALIGFLVYLAGMFQLREKVIAERERDIFRLREALNSVADGLFCWRYKVSEDNDRHYCSRRLATLLGLARGTLSQFDDIVRSFDEEGAASLARRADMLCDSGIGFSINISIEMSARQFHVRGERVFAEDSSVLADLVWFRDITEERSRIGMLEAERRVLKVENSRLRRFQDSLTLPVWMRDNDLNLIYCNQSYADTVGVSSPSAAIDTAIELVSGGQAREARTLAIRARAIGEARSGQFHLVINGARRLMEVTELPLHDPGGDEKITVGFAVDKTRQEELEDTLKEHVVAHANVLENLTTAIAIFNKDTRLVFFNAAFSTLWNVSSDWLSSQPSYGNFLDMLRELRHLPEVVDYRAFRNEELKMFTSLIESQETLLHLPNGKALRRLVSPHPFGGLLLTYEDVTDTLALTSSYNTLIAVQHEIINSLHEGVATFGADGRLRLFNSAFARLWNLDEHILAAQPHLRELEDWLRTLLDDEADPRQCDAWRHNYAAASSVSDERKVMSGRITEVDGKVLDYLCVPLSDGAVLSLWLDVSDSVQMEQVLWERNEMLSRDNYLKTNFLSAISREIRAPLDVIVMLSERLTNDPAPLGVDQRHIFGRDIADAAKTLVMMVDNMLDMAVSEKRKGSFHSITATLSEIFAVSIALIREAAQERNVHLTVNSPPSVGELVIAEMRFKLTIFIMINEVLTLTRTNGWFGLSGEWSDDSKKTLILSFANTTDELNVMQGYSWNEKKSLRQILVLLRNLVEPHGGSVTVYHDPAEVGAEFRRMRIVCRIMAAFPVFSSLTPSKN